MKRAVIYLRVSTGKQVEGASLDTQEMMCQQWAIKNDLIIDKIYKEEGVSAKTLNRPAMQKLLAHLHKNKGRIAYLVTYQTDRLTRNAADFYALKVELKRLGVEYKNVNSQAGESTANDELIQGIEAVLAQHDNKIKSDRVKQNMSSQAQDGYRMSKAPYGLRNTRDILGKSTVEPVPELGDKVAQVLEAYSTGTYTIAKLLRYSQDLGLKSSIGKEFSFQHLSKLLRHPLYAGLDKSKHTNGKLVKSHFAGIITPAVFYKNQELLKKNGKTVATYQTINPDFPLRRFLNCVNCNKPLRGSSPTSATGRRYARYHCTGCKAPSIDTDTMHEHFNQMLKDLQPAPETNKFIREIIIRVWKDEMRKLAISEKKSHRRLEELRTRKIAVLDKLVSGQLTVPEKDELASSIETEIDATNKQLIKVHEVSRLREEAIDYALGFMNNASKLWEDATIDTKIIYQRLIFPEGVNFDLNTGIFGTTKLSPLYTLATMKKDPSEADESLLVTPRRVELLLPG